MKMIFLDNFLHMDLHPGNVMVVSRPNGRGNDVFTLAFIDAGMVTELSPVDHKHLSGILGAMFRFNGPEAARLMVENQLADGGLQVGAAARSPSGGGGGSRGSTNTTPRAKTHTPGGRQAPHLGLSPSLRSMASLRKRCVPLLAVSTRSVMRRKPTQRLWITWGSTSPGFPRWRAIVK